MATLDSDKSKDKGLRRLTEILQKAVDDGADSVQLEYVSGGMEVCFMFGHVGVGAVLIDRALEREVVGYIVDHANLTNKSRSPMKIDLRSGEHIIHVKQYDNFGESAFILEIQKPARKNKGK